MLTGVKDIDIIILNKLEDQDLVRVCQVNKLADRICKDQPFWLNRILSKFPYLPLEILNKYKKDRSWSQYYINDLRRINNNSNKYLIDGARFGRLDHVIISLQMGADVHAHYDQAIRFASENGYIDIVKYLVEAGANIHTHDDIIIGLASENGHIDTVRYLLGIGVDIHENDDEAIREASYNGHIDIVKYLAEAGANIHALGDYAVEMAEQRGHDEVVDYLRSLP